MRNYIQLLLLIFLTNNLISQTLDAGAYGSDGLFLFGITKTRPVPSMRVKGSMYYNKKFQPGYLRYYNKMMTEKSYMRYNAFTDEIEMASSEITDNSSIIVFKDRHIAPVFSGETYVYLPYRLDDGRAYIGYLIEIYNGDKFNLYLRRNKQFMEEVKARTGMDNPFPPRYIDRMDFYISFNSGTPSILKPTKKRILSYFPNNQDEIRAFIKSYKLKVSEKESIVRIFEFAEKLE